MAKHAIKVRGIVINGRRTSLRLEPEYWEALRDAAAWLTNDGKPATGKRILEYLHECAMKEHRGFASMVRSFLMFHYKHRAERYRTQVTSAHTI